MSIQKHSDWAAGLPANVWSEVFSRLAGELHVSLSLPWKLNKYVRSQARYYELHLVCQTFHAVFQQDSHLSGRVILPVAFDDQSLPSLLLWLQQHGKAVRTLVACVLDPHSSKAIQALLIDAPGLSRAQILCCSPTTVRLLSMLSSLTTCELNAPVEDKCLNIDALQSLDNLQVLALMDGDFCAAQLPCHLTSLRMEHAVVKVSHSCACTPSLQKLSLLKSQLSKFHEQGVFACLSLETLCCCPGSIDAEQAPQMLMMHRERFPAFPSATDFAALSRLNTLKLDFGREPGRGPIDFSPLYVLTSLESLWLRCRLGDLAVAVTPGFSALTRLR